MLSEAQIKSIRSSKNVVFAAFAVVGAIALYNWLVTPHVNYLLASQKYASVTDKLAKKSGFIRNNAKIREKKLKELQEKFKDIHIKLFDTVEAEEFFSDIQAIAEQTNCIIYSLKFSPTNTALETDQSKVSNDIRANRATLSVAGKYKDIVALINKLQDRPKQVWADSISIEPISDNSDLLKCDMTITIYAIYNEAGHSYD